LASVFNDELMAQRHTQKQSSALPIAIAQLPCLAAEIEEEADDLRSISIPMGRYRAFVCMYVQARDMRFKEMESDADGFADPVDFKLQRSSPISALRTEQDSCPTSDSSQDLG
jgi:hypothetical protein